MELEQGLYLFFWQWPASVQELVKFGQPLWLSKALPKFTKSQPFERNPQQCLKVLEKLSNVQEKRSIEPATFGFPRGTLTFEWYMTLLNLG